MGGSAVLLCGHGSRDPAAIGEFATAAAALRTRVMPRDFALAHLEFAHPSLQEAFAMLAARGARQIVVLPAMLFGAGHVTKDLPREISRFVAANPQVGLTLGLDLSAEPRCLAVAADRITAAAPGEHGDCLLLVVGRGSSDPTANARLCRIATSLGNRLGFAQAGAAFSGIAEPPVEAALDDAARQGFRRIIVMPYFLFTGILVKRLQEQIGAMATRSPTAAVVIAQHLGGDPRIIDAWVERAGEAVMPDIW